MKRLTFGVLAGLVFAALDLIPMAFMDHPNKGIAMAGAFFDRFAIGFLVPNVSLPFGAMINGMAVGLLLSLPGAIISGLYMPILGVGVIGGLVIGVLAGKFCPPR